MNVGAGRFSEEMVNTSRNTSRPIYVVVQPTGKKTVDNEEIVIILDVKLTRHAADAVSAHYPGSKVEKYNATKTT